jgi:hypothetical protein
MAQPPYLPAQLVKKQELQQDAQFHSWPLLCDFLKKTAII